MGHSKVNRTKTAETRTLQLSAGLLGLTVTFSTLPPTAHTASLGSCAPFLRFSTADIPWSSHPQHHGVLVASWNLLSQHYGFSRSDQVYKDTSLWGIPGAELWFSFKPSQKVYCPLLKEGMAMGAGGSWACYLQPRS